MLIPRIKLKFVIYISFACLLVLTVSNFSLAVSREEYANSLSQQAEQYSKQKGKEFLALGYINEAIKLQPSNLNNYYRRAFVLGRARLYAAAINDLNLVIRNDPGNKKFPSALKYRAECYAAMNDIDNAIKDYRRMLKRAPKSDKLWLYYAELLWFAGMKSESLKAIEMGYLANGHRRGKLKNLHKKILSGERVKLHTPFSN